MHAADGIDMEEDMYIIDSHCDTIYILDKGKQKLVNPYNFSKKHPQLQFCAMFCTYAEDTPEDSFKRAVRYTGHFAMSMADPKNNIVWVKSYDEIKNALENGKHAGLLTIEGGSCIKDSLEVFEDFYNVGVRVFGLAWHSNSLAKCNNLNGEDDTGLTDFGRAVIARGNELGMIFDASHLSDKSFWDVIELTKKPLIASHSNFRSLCPHTRNLTDDMAKAIFEHDGMIGLNLAPGFIHEAKEKRTVATLFEHFDYCLALGGENHIGFGGDIDGINSYPAPLDLNYSIHDALIEYMLEHNYSEELIEKLAYKNYMSYLEKYL